MTYCPLLLRKPQRPYSPSLLRALAEAQDRMFASVPEGLVGHANDWESRVANKVFYLVKGTHKYQDRRRSTTHCTTFQSKDDALTFAARWRLNCPDDDITILASATEWLPFVATTKTDVALMKTITTKPTTEPTP